ncbi:hypothetical protein EZV62_024049 [Acer yangbiense]|uniref:C3HC-type domain-containing protein n=1 Tax=Acer yangbiense TaxID=1000413 RepID=A0A5C7H492_9ROSI|nr:hypothetical protein EZV62_024049 [Acer yangbiense]
MAGDSEKRFHSIMDKLFHAPKSIPPPSSCSIAESRRGMKLRNGESALALVTPNVMEKSQHSSEAPMCRPWDRGDLMRRLATFKSMTWFAKPKVVSAVNCARRGWVNVDTDIIACESCGALEKAALVFSLKLDNGHKLLCPWIDNACDETLAQFPPTPPPVLVDKFRERSSTLLQLLALPVISSSAIECMRIPQLEEFLKQSSTLEYGNDFLSPSQSDSLDNECEDQSAKLYFQAHNLISLCGWEPRSLPYVVECKDTAGSNEIVEATGNSGAHKAVVLDCRLCGASVGLWAFSTVPCPLEIFRFEGYSEVSGGKNAGTHASSNVAPLCKESSSGLNLTIAGGPPPTKQSFKATISLPVVGRTLRARFSNDSDFRGCTYDNHEEIRSAAMNKNLSLDGIECAEHNLSGHVVQTIDMSSLKSKQNEHGLSSSISEDQSPCLNHNVGEKGDTPENNIHVPTEGRSVTGLVPSSETGTHCSLTQNATGTTQKPGLSQSNGLPENAANVELINSADWRIVCSGVRGPSITTPDSNFTIGNEECSQNGRSLMVTSDNAVMARSPDPMHFGFDLKKQLDRLEGEGRIDEDLLRERRLIKTKLEEFILKEEIMDANFYEGFVANEIGVFRTLYWRPFGNRLRKLMLMQKAIELRQMEDKNKIANLLDVVKAFSLLYRLKINFSKKKDLKQLPEDNSMKFDPIMQHRHFCPWIVSTGSGPPGWQQTLSALQRKRDRSHPSPTNSRASASIIKVDDPIASVRKLFSSPVTKRMKTSHGSK